MSTNIVSCRWLVSHLTSPDICVLDASWHLPTAKRDARAEFLACHVPRAQFFDIDAFSDTASPLPHMLPSPEKFASMARKLGIGDGKRIICYDAAGLFSAARAWWMFKAFGHDDVAILDGGLPSWLKEGHPIEDGPAARPQERHFTARFHPSMVADITDVASALKDGSAQVADARSPTRFRGQEAEPRPGVRPGHMPGAANLHYASLLNGDGTLKAPEALAAAVAASGIDIQRPVITSCGSGVTAAILSLALSELGANQHSLYDGSWTEWGGNQDYPVATGS